MKGVRDGTHWPTCEEEILEKGVLKSLNKGGKKKRLWNWKRVGESCKGWGFSGILWDKERRPERELEGGQGTGIII